MQESKYPHRVVRVQTNEHNFTDLDKSVVEYALKLTLEDKKGGFVADIKLHSHCPFIVH